MRIEGATHAVMCETDIEHLLASCLKEGHIIVIDTVRIHKEQKVCELMEASGWFQPCGYPVSAARSWFDFSGNYCSGTLLTEDVGSFEAHHMRTL